ncbi:MAG: hypothetical protein ABFD52_01310 [Acidobacteriota bacterium]
MSASVGRARTMENLRMLAAVLSAVSLAAACSVYKFKDMDGRALAAKGRRGKIISVQTADESITFAASDPPAVKNGALVGNLHLTYTIDPLDIADITGGGTGPKVVLKDGSRFRVVSSRAEGDKIKCQAVKVRWIPLDRIMRARVRKINGPASVLKALAGVVVFVGVFAIDAVFPGEDEDALATEVEATVDVLNWMFKSEGGGANGKIGRRGSNAALLEMDKSYDTAAETEFWAMEWTPVDAAPDADGKLRIRLGNPSGVTRGVDEAKLVVVDHAPGVGVFPDVRGAMRGCAAPVAPETATARNGRDIKNLVSARDGVFWRTADGEAAPAAAPPSRDEITLSFPRPKDARRAKLIVAAANSSWRAEFAREVKARLAASPAPSPPAPSPGQADHNDHKKRKNDKDKGQAPLPSRPQRLPQSLRPGYEEWEYGRVRVQLLTAFGWQTGQALLAGGPLPAGDMIYNLDLDDIGTDKVWLKLSPPARYWLVDRLALDFGADGPVERTDIDAGDVDGPDAAEVLLALAAEDGTTFLIGPEDQPALLTFTLPPPKGGLERTLFLRTVSCYATPPAARTDK